MEYAVSRKEARLRRLIIKLGRIVNAVSASENAFNRFKRTKTPRLFYDLVGQFFFRIADVEQRVLDAKLSSFIAAKELLDIYFDKAK